MKLSEFGSLVLSGNKREIKDVDISESDIELFTELLSIDSSIKNYYDNCTRSLYFFKKYTSIKDILGKDKCSEIFYACKSGIYYKGIPSIIVYHIKTTMETIESKYVNQCLSLCQKNISLYADCKFKSGDQDVTLHDVINNIFRTNSKLITESNYKVKASDCYEIYISTCDKVALVPNDIAERLSQEDCEALSYDSKRGIVLDDIPLRTINDRLGVTFNDFDLRECV